MTSGHSEFSEYSMWEYLELWGIPRGECNTGSRTCHVRGEEPSLWDEESNIRRPGRYLLRNGAPPKALGEVEPRGAGGGWKLGDTVRTAILRDPRPFSAIAREYDISYQTVRRIKGVKKGAPRSQAPRRRLETVVWERETNARRQKA